MYAIRSYYAMSCSEGGALMGSKLYVGGLPYAATESQLTTLFAAHGTVESARVIVITSYSIHYTKLYDI